jgi:hypothetical protein
MKFIAEANYSSANSPAAITFGTTTTGNLQTERMRISSNGYVGIGTSTPDSLLEISANSAALPPPGATFPGTLLHLGAVNASKSRVLLDAYGPGGPGDGGPAVFPIFTGRMARGTAAAPTAVQADDTLFMLNAGGYGASAYSNGGQVNIRLLAADNWTDTDHGSAIAFNTTPNGSIAYAERMRIDQNGNVGIGTTTPQTALEVNGGARLNTTTAQPACGAATRGTFWVLQGASGVADQVQVCMKDALNNYSWQAVGGGGGGVLPGTLCGFDTSNCSGNSVPCQGMSPAGGSCPSGYSAQGFATGQNSGGIGCIAYTCVKN